jgi:3-phenylpropionate/trans-cinnamate dioxygenase beta subunit/p-cumate 2,3-dioxygenase beta subunit
LDTETLRKLETRLLVEDFMFMEARLLDDWRLSEWLDLMTEDARYEVPATDVRGDISKTLAIISDNMSRLRQRVDQLLGNVMWCENPRSRTRRLVSNICVLRDGDGVLEVLANFVIHRFGNGRSDTFVGKYEHELVRAGGSFKVRKRTVRLDHESLFEHAKISIIL